MSVSAALLGKDVDVEHGESIGYHADLIMIWALPFHVEQHVLGANSYMMLHGFPCSHPDDSKVNQLTSSHDFTSPGRGARGPGPHLPPGQGRGVLPAP